MPGVQHGEPEEIADSLRQLRETYGITYFATLDTRGNLEAFANVISQFGRGEAQVWRRGRRLSRGGVEAVAVSRR